MKKRFFLCAFQLLSIIFAGRAQTAGQLTVNDCYKLAEQNYPLIKQRELIAKTADYTIENIQKGYLPQLNINGQATYQSAVTAIPIKLPGLNIPTISKDQYKLYGELSQVLYDGGEIRQQKQLQKSDEAVSQQQLEADLYQLKDRVNQLFFGVILLDEQLKQNDLVIKDIQLGHDKIMASIKYGIAFRSNGDLITAELLKNKQQTIELRASRKAYTDMLSLFIGKTVDEETLKAFLAKKLKQNEPKLLRDQKKPKVFGLKQIDTNPPHFELLVNYPAAISSQFRKFVENSIIKELDFWGTPINFRLKGKDKS